jgi:RNA polymerase sigma-70 factor (ECF subfamily)
LSPPTAKHEASDADLIAGVARGDRQAFAALYDRNGAILFGIVLRILRSRSEAEEVLQEVFLQIWQGARGFDESRGQPLPWLTLLARSRALDRLRARTVRDRTAAAVAAEPDPQVGDAADEVALSEIGLTVRRALAEISADQRTALTLAYFEGLTQSEIAVRLDRPLGTVKTHTRLGLARLRELLNELGAKR